MQENRILKNMPVKMWLPWKRQIAWIKKRDTKLWPDKFQEKLLGLVAFASIFSVGTFWLLPPHPHPCRPKGSYRGGTN